MLQHAAAPVPPPFRFRPSTKQLDPVQLPAPKIRTHLAAAAGSSSSSSSSLPVAAGSFQDATLLSLLRQRKTDEAYQVYARSPVLPGPTCLSRLLAQLSYQNTPAALARARALVRRLRDEGKLHCLDANSLGLLAVSAARSGSTAYALALLRTMLRSGYLPHVKAWSAVVSRLSASEDGPAEALRLFDSVVRRLRRVPAIAAADARPDAAAFNAALNACANLGDVRRFAHLFNEMSQYQVAPDVLTHNVLIKMCARAGRKDLLVFALRRIIAADLVPCITTLHSLVAAYVGFDDQHTTPPSADATRKLTPSSKS